MLLKGLSNIVEVIETSSPDEVNMFLGEGWKLLNTYKTTFSTESDAEAMMYVLGKDQDELNG